MRELDALELHDFFRYGVAKVSKGGALSVVHDLFSDKKLLSESNKLEYIRNIMRVVL